MGAFRYCIHCGFPMDKPDILEDLLTGTFCKQCGSQQPQVYAQPEWMKELAERLEEAEKRINKLENKNKILSHHLRKLIDEKQRFRKRRQKT